MLFYDLLMYFYSFHDVFTVFMCIFFKLIFVGNLIVLFYEFAVLYTVQSPIIDKPGIDRIFRKQISIKLSICRIFFWPKIYEVVQNLGMVPAH